MTILFLGCFKSKMLHVDCIGEAMRDFKMKVKSP